MYRAPFLPQCVREEEEEASDISRRSSEPKNKLLRAAADSCSHYCYLGNCLLGVVKSAARPCNAAAHRAPGEALVTGTDRSQEMREEKTKNGRAEAGHGSERVEKTQRRGKRLRSLLVSRREKFAQRISTIFCFFLVSG